MLTRLTLVMNLIRNMGIRYVAYRIVFELEHRFGVLVRRFPTKPVQKKGISLSDWKKNPPPFLIPSRSNLAITKKKSTKLEGAANRILNGEIQFFYGKWYPLTINYDWLTNPETGYTYPLWHWSKIADFDKTLGDIKYVWEKSRFSYIQTIIRYDYHYDLDHSEWVFSEIDSWIMSNPINQGPNWRCSQEISLRLLNWCYALYFYMDSPSLTEERWSDYQNVIYWKLHHIYKHINFSRIAVRNNHAITETGMLFISGLIFPFIPETKIWSEAGKKWLEEEVDYQIYDDGTFLQFSMNYHRVVVQLLTLFLRLNELYQAGLSTIVADKAYKSLRFLFTCQDQSTGQLPNYGANDGALFFNWTDSSFRDFRPQLNTLHALLTKADLYKHSQTCKEDSQWFGVTKGIAGFKRIENVDGLFRFERGGYYIIREGESLTFLRCGNHKDRPSQADNLHLDIWVNGENILRDAGSYKYNAEDSLVNYFMGTASHNTVMIGDENQMLKGRRFIWFYWSQLVSIAINHEEDFVEIIGKVKVYQHLGQGIIHLRKVRKTKGSLKWLVEDELIGVDGLRHSFKQLWHGPDIKNLQLRTLKGSIKPEYRSGWYSSHYGIKEQVKDLCFEFNKSISTEITYNP